MPILRSAHDVQIVVAGAPNAGVSSIVETFGAVGRPPSVAKVEERGEAVIGQTVARPADRARADERPVRAAKDFQAQQEERTVVLRIVDRCVHPGVHNGPRSARKR